MWPTSEVGAGGVFRVDYDAVTHTAAEQRSLRNELIRCRDERRDAQLPAGALGRILPSEDLLRAVGLADEATRRRMWIEAHRCRDLHETLREFRNDVQAVDADVADLFRSLLGELGAVGAPGGIA
ncbi:hypothetical protein [Nocardioides sp. B-3]|uniref:hypothetical protein n=1 Tax=Nocardioides sp. B-3 TaxID=2895565 RepID=UPI0021533C42|nr:hypothetical protein [Nocardioides sp. B-3]UUZ61167.1 hypothetical protein LP418_11400 [Nocardioides sp. B-3]